MFVFLLFFSFGEKNVAQEKWYANTSVQLIDSDIQDGSSRNTIYFNNGIRYQTPNYFFGLNVPLVLNQIANENSNEQITSNTSNMMNGELLEEYKFGIGDIYINGSIVLLNETMKSPSIALDGYLKIPTASTELGIGTGKFDSQFALSVRKFINNISIYGQFGYLILGNIEGEEIMNPYTISIGIGYMFANGNHSVLLAYDSYTTIFQGVQSPKQIAVGYNLKISNGLFATSFISAGLSNSTSNFTISGGLNYEL